MFGFDRGRESVRYAQVRSIAYRTAEKDLEDGPRINATLTSIDRNALARWRRDWLPLEATVGEYGGWNWEEISASYIRRLDAFHLALWAEGILCGMAVGKVSRNRSRLAIHYLEGTPQQPNPLRGRIVLSTLVAATRYAQALGVHLLRVRNPIPPMARWLERAGFVLEMGGKLPEYWDRRIE